MCAVAAEPAGFVSWLKLLTRRPQAPQGPPAAAAMVSMLSPVEAGIRWSGSDDWRAAGRPRGLAERLLQRGADRDAMVRLQEQLRRFELALDYMSQGLCLFDPAKRLVISNRRYAELYGLTPDQIRCGMTLREIVELRATAGSDPVMSYEDYISWVPSRDSVRSPSGMVVALKNGRTMSIRHQPLSDGGYVATHEDITERLIDEARVAHMAVHDALTGLPNRLLFRERLVQALSSLGGAELCAVLYLDLDCFKNINDTLGHLLGDALLSAVTERLVRSVPASHTVARIGGDEFAILQPRLQQLADASDLAERLIGELGAPHELSGRHVVIGTSIGIAVAPQDGADPDQLMKNADLALYSAKLEGRRRCCFFQPRMAAAMERRRTLEFELRTAFSDQNFVLHFQPLVDLHSGQGRGFEALLRWQTADRGLVSASEFIALAEEIGLTIAIGEWVLEQACRAAAGWPADLRVAVNISGEQLKSGSLVPAVAAALARSGLPASRLELEITETAVAQVPAAFRAVLHQLKAAGVSIALDDFGTGYSSLSYIRDLPFDRIKIDRGFVQDLGRNRDAVAIVRAVTGLCKSLGKRTTAEGVETEEQLALLKAEHYDEIQGFLLGRPRPLEEVPDVLRSLRMAGSDRPRHEHAPAV